MKILLKKTLKIKIFLVNIANVTKVCFYASLKILNALSLTDFQIHLNINHAAVRHIYIIVFIYNQREK